MTTVERAISSLMDDKYDRAETARKVADFLMTEFDLPNMFGIYGNWGSGKTSFMNMMSEHMEAKYAQKLVVRFEPWKYEFSDQSNLVFALLRAIERAAQKANPSVKFLDDSLKKKIGRILLTAGSSALASVQTKFDIGIASASCSFDINKMSKHAELWDSYLLTDYENWINEVEDFESEFKMKIGTLKDILKVDSIVVFIDDLDRCFPDKTVKLLEAIKNFFMVDDVLFVIGAAHHVIAEMIEANYKIRHGYGSEYLTKIIPYFYELSTIPLGKVALEVFDTYGIKSLFEEKESIVAITRMLERFTPEPRRAKHILNQVSIRIIFGGDKLYKYVSSKTEDSLSRALIIFALQMLITLYPKIKEGNAVPRLKALAQIANDDPTDRAFPQRQSQTLRQLSDFTDHEIEQMSLILRFGCEKIEKAGYTLIRVDEIADAYHELYPIS